jgi:hypothetical protein
MPKQLLDKTRPLVAHPNVQHPISVAQFVKLRGAGVVRGAAAAGISRGNLTCFFARKYRLAYLPSLRL